MKQTILFFINTILVAIIIAGVYDGCRMHREAQMQSDTIFLHDTLLISSPTPVSTTPMGSKFVFLPKVALGQPMAVTDTLRDSVLVDVPLESKTYTDDSTYKAKVSGFMVSLDEIEIYRQKEVITNTITSKYKPWSVGVGVGLGYNGKVEPFVGVSVHYKLWEW